MRDDDEQKRALVHSRPSATAGGSSGPPGTHPGPDLPSIASPTLALPKGGGSIRGLGEKFSPNAATGAGGFSVPVYTSPGRGGLQPTLSISYSSGAGNGPFGLGFSMSLPSIARRTEKRLPRYDDSDAFVLSGAEELVPSTFHGIWDQGTRKAGKFLVALYQPRVDKLFARIERWTDMSSGDFYWRAITHDNQVNIYGQSEAARVADPDDPRRVFRWLLESTTDGKGNQIAYRYRTEDGVGVAPALHEERRRGTNVYLDRILYGNRASALDGAPRPDHAEDWLFELVCDYGERAAQVLPTPPAYVPAAPWRARLDAFSTFKPGFEVRTHRLCHRLLMFHRIEDANAPVLVRSTDLGYDEGADITFLTSATQTGYDPAQTPAYQQLPPVALSYTKAIPDAGARAVDRGSLAHLPSAVDGSRYQWVDLDSEGLSGVLTEQGRAWFYKRNEGSGRLGAAALVAERPAMASLAGGQHLADIERDGHRYLVQWGGETPGAQPRLADGTWGPFAPFRSRPVQPVQDPNARLIDLDGDGRADLLVTEDTVLRWYPSLGREGFGPSQARTKPWDEEKGPALVFADAEQTIHLADMTGDGLSDLVRIRNGEVCYWPNLGFGRFGAKIAMTGAPRFDHPESFDRRRLRLTDVDGSGTTDLIYLDSDGARYWLNCAGNSFDGGHRLDGFPGYDDAASVDATDLLGNGTSCLVWSTNLPGNPGRAMRYLELTGGVKPHLLASVDNGRGLTTSVTYAASTEFYLTDRAAGRPWATRLPFPVHVVKQLEALDAVTGDRLTTLFAYHHGFYDAVEWEFRGFGMVEQWDAEQFDANRPEDVLRVPPIHTKTWFHTGAFLEGDSLARRFAAEAYQVDGVFGAALPESQVEGVVTAVDAREAARALAGQVLRREVYADDGGPGAPFAVELSNYHVKALQVATSEQHGIFITRARETLRLQLERDPSDPRVSHEVVLASDDFGQVTEVVSLAYPRRATKLEGVPGQDAVLATYASTSFGNVIDQDDWFRVGAPLESRTWEVRGFVNAPTPPGPLTIVEPAFLFDVVAQAAQAAAVGDEVPFNPNAFQRRLVMDTQLRYRADDGTTELAPGAIESRGLLARTRRLAFSQTLLDGVFDANHPLPPGLALANGYELEAGQYWARSTAATYRAGVFYQANVFTDAFGNQTTVGFDANALFTTSLTNALASVTRAVYDTRVLQPSTLIGANGEQSLAAFDPLGRVVATALQSAAPVGTQPPPAGDVLDAPTTDASYHLDGLPNFMVTRARETHQFPDHVGEPPNWRYTYTYYDGFGREVLTKVEDDDGQPGTRPSTRWVGTGRTIYNNKGNPVKKYEPYSSGGSGYESEQAIVRSGVTDVLRYDPLDRVIRTDHPNGTFTLVAFDPWTQRSYDENDTLDGHGPNAWLARFGANPPVTAQEIAATAAFEHRDTPMVTRFDVLGRAVDTRATNVEYPTGERTPVEYPTVATLDILGNALTTTVVNQKQDGTTVLLAVMTQVLDMLGRPLLAESADSGSLRKLADAAGQPLFVHDARGFRVTVGYDALRRPLTRMVRAPGATADAVTEQSIYGEGLVNPTDENGAPATAPSLYLIGRLYQQRDGAGTLTHVRYDFKGNLRYQSRRLRTDYTTLIVDWSEPVVNGVDPNALDAATYLRSATWDAMNRVVSAQEPDATTITNGYGKRRLLRTVDVAPRGGTAQQLVTGIDYNERGQRKQIRYNNGASTSYGYEPDTFRLSTLDTVDGQAAPLQGLAYTYDPVGNLARIDDSASPSVTFNGGGVSSSQTFVYDALYRLAQATGREHIAQTSDKDQTFGFNLPAPTQANAFRNYTERYAYDRLGNLRSMQHQASVGGGAINNWMRLYETEPATSNRLLSTSASGAEPGPHYSIAYEYDECGNMIRVPHLGGAPGQPNCFWGEKNELLGAALNAAIDPADAADRAYYTYDASGQRVRKVVVAAANVRRERIYLGDYEIFRHNSGGAVTERHSVHVMDDRRRVALVETKTNDAGTAVPNRQPVVRYQHDNHLGSSLFELDAAGKAISREEYHPFGTTSYYAGPAALLDVDIKRYRYTAKERDDETGFYYHVARYCAPWLGRWISADPAGSIDGWNLYAYVRNNPVRLNDPGGTDGDDDDDDDDEPKPPPPPGTSQVAGRSLDTFTLPKLKLNPPNFLSSSYAQGIGKMTKGSVDVEANVYLMGSSLGGITTTTGYGLSLAQGSVRKQIASLRGLDVGFSLGGAYTSQGTISGDVATRGLSGALTAHYGYQWKNNFGLALYVAGGYAAQRAGSGSGSGWVTTPLFNSSLAVGYESNWPKGLDDNTLALRFAGIDVTPTGSYADTGQLSQGPTLRSLYTVGGYLSGSVFLSHHVVLSLEGGGIYSSGSADPSANQTGQSGTGRAGLIGTYSWIDRTSSGPQTSSVSIGVWYSGERGSISGPSTSASPSGSFRTDTVMFGATFGYRRSFFINP